MSALGIALAVLVVVMVLLCWRTWRIENATRRQQARLAALTQRMRSIVDSAIDSAQITDLIVQHAKNPTASHPELQSLARLVRSSLLAMIAELDAHARALQNWPSAGRPASRQGWLPSFARSRNPGRRRDS